MKKVAPGVAEAAPGTPPADERARYEALGYVGVGPDSNARNADPQRPVEIVERYRAAVDAAAARNWTLAIDAFRALLREQPPTVNLWLHLANTAARAERQNIALDAYRHAVEIDAEDSEAQLGAATVLLKLRKLDEARQHAASVAEGDGPDTAPRAAAHEILARIALAHHDADLARAEAAEAEAADSHRPIRAYVEGRLAYDQGQYGDAVASFEDALAVLEKVKGRALQDLRVYAAEALVRLDRHGEAEYLLMQELTDFPASARARASLAALYRSTGRPDEAAVTLSAH
jgi:tetratricopeptide (TPR) repeat protein